MLPTKKSSAPIQKEGTGPKALPDEEERGPQSQGGGRPSQDDGMVVLWRGFDDGGFLEKVKVKVEALVELLEFVVVLMEMEEEEDEGRELERL